MPRKYRKKKSPMSRPAASRGLSSAMAAFVDPDEIVENLLALRNALAQQCEMLQSRIAATDMALGDMTRRPAKGSPARPRKRSAAAPRGPRGKGESLKDYLLRVLKDSSKPLRVMELEAGVRRAGYPTQSKNLSNQISMALSELAKKRKIKKLDRGVFGI